MNSLPDQDTQFLCRSCSKWLGKDEIGARIADVNMSASLLNSFAKSVAGLNHDRKERFICKKCKKKKTTRYVVIFSLFAIVALIALVLGKLKLI